MLVLLEGWEGSGVCCPLLELDVGVGWVLFFIFYPFVEIGAEVFFVDSSVSVYFYGNTTIYFCCVYTSIIIIYVIDGCFCSISYNRTKVAIL